MKSTYLGQVTVLYWHTPTTTPEGGVELYFEPDTVKFVMGVLGEFDLDICRMGIHDEYYYSKYKNSLLKKSNIIIRVGMVGQTFWTAFSTRTSGTVFLLPLD